MGDIKYDYIHGEDKFFYILNLIDIFDRSIIDYPMGFHCEAKDAKALLRKCLMRRNLFEEVALKPVIITDTGPQLVSYKFSECCKEIGIKHERIPNKTPNKNAHIESFHRILEDDCLKKYEFQSYSEVYEAVNELMEFYNLHFGETITNIEIRV